MDHFGVFISEFKTQIFGKWIVFFYGHSSGFASKISSKHRQVTSRILRPLIIRSMVLNKVTIRDHITTCHHSNWMLEIFLWGVFFFFDTAHLEWLGILIYTYTAARRRGNTFCGNLTSSKVRCSVFVSVYVIYTQNKTIKLLAANVSHHFKSWRFP